MFKKFIVTFTFSICLMGLPQNVSADLLEIFASPQFGEDFNVFHDAAIIDCPFNLCTDGSILGWFDLDTTKTNTYDPDTGALSASFNIYETEALTNNIGTVVATGNLPASNFTANAPNTGSGNELGVLAWAFMITDTTAFNNSGTSFTSNFQIDATFLDFNGPDEVFGRPANSWENGFLTLWGGDGYVDDGSGPNGFGFYDITQATMGIDVVLQTRAFADPNAVPEPTSMLLFGTGLVGAAIRKRFVV